jgi:hypothetical protein
MPGLSRSKRLVSVVPIPSILVVNLQYMDAASRADFAAPTKWSPTVPHNPTDEPPHHEYLAA